MHTISAIIIARDAAETIEKTLTSLAFAAEIIVVDDNSTDETAVIAEKYNAVVIHGQGGDFSHKRNVGLKAANQPWILYIDADEVVTPELQQKIVQIITTSAPAAYKIKRRNYFLGREMYSDIVDRLFHRSVISGWTGKVHESPQISVPTTLINQSLLHYTHRSIESMLTKTNEWSEYEAELRFDAHHPPIAWWRLVRIGVTTFSDNYLGKQLWRYGRQGLFEAYFQMIDKLIVYTKLWEKQH